MPGDLVCDVFSGSGTTQQAALETGRAFVGADLFYENLRAARLAQAVPDLICHLPGVSDESIAVWQAETVRVETPAVYITTQQESRLIQETFRY
jgi:site-specific DNA-methyltransferase (adenine-specific)